MTIFIKYDYYRNVLENIMEDADMKIVGRTQMLSDYGYEECIDRLINLGFEGVEISIFDKNFEVRECFFDEATQNEISKTVKGYDGNSFMYSAHQDYIYNDANYGAIQKAIPVVAKLGGSILIISGTEKKAETIEEAAVEWNQMIERTRRFVSLGEEHNVVIAIEYEPNFIVGTTKDLHRLFKEIDSPYLGANLDLGHVFLCDEKPLEAIKSLKGKIINGHIEDMAEGVHDHLVPGHGDMNLGDYIDALKSVAFDGSLGLDLYKYDYEAVAEESIAYLKLLMT